MKLRDGLISVAAAIALLFSISAVAGWWPFSNDDESSEGQETVVEVEWPDLIPDDFEQPENPFEKMTQEEIDKLMDGSAESNAEIERLQKEFSYAPVVSELDGMRVKIPAYITPLEYNENLTIKEFLLVPYLGACMHSPPPPANQIVHGKLPEAIKFENMYDPVWAVGTIRAETITSDLAESGYQMKVEKIMPYINQ